MKETMLNPRKRPKRPPREETNSTGPIEIPLSSSFEKKIFNLIKINLTCDSLLSKEDVERSDVLIPCIVRSRPSLGFGWKLIFKSHLRWQFDQRVKVFVSLWADDALDVVWQAGVVCLVVNLLNLKPFLSSFLKQKKVS